MLPEPQPLNHTGSIWGRAATAFFCSQSCPGDIILKAQDWANARGPDSAPVTGGFHTPVERDVLRILLRGNAPVIMVLARAAQGWRAPKPLGPAIKTAVAVGTAQIVSPFPATQTRTTAITAEARNRHILTLCKTVLIAHAAHGSKTEALAQEAKTMGLPIFTLPSPANSHLLQMGAQIVPDQ
jgi:hypothetical protein